MVEYKDLCFVAKVLEEKNLDVIYEEEFYVDYLKSDVRPVWNFILDFFASYSNFPTQELLKNKFSLELPKDTFEPLSFWIHELKERHLSEQIIENQNEVNENIKRGDSKKALEHLRTFVSEAIEKIDVKNFTSLSDYATKVEKNNYEIFRGKKGIQTPWPTINAWTMGWAPGELSLIAARLGVGKTWFLIFNVFSARCHDKRTLMISGEMKASEILDRYTAFDAKVPYTNFLKGQLQDFEKQRYQHTIQKYTKDKDLIVMDGSLGFHMTQVEFAIQKFKPELVAIDAAYLLKAKTKAKDRTENMANVADELKSLAMRFDIPILATVQMNRSSNQKNKPDDEGLALTDNLGWAGKSILALKQDDDARQARQMEVWPVKIREGENAKQALILNWDFFHMDFTEIKMKADSNGQSAATALPIDSFL